MDLKQAALAGRIFRDERLLSSDPYEFLPEKIYGREEQLSALARIFAPPFRAWRNGEEIHPISRAAAFGPSGTGKSVTIRWYVEHQVSPFIDETGTPLEICQINCREFNTASRVMARVGACLEKDFKQKGLSSSEAWERVTEILESDPISLAIVLDEADFLERKSKDWILYVLTRPPVKKAKIEFILVSASRIRLYEGLSPGTKSSLGTPYPIEFAHYDEPTLFKILKAREQAFVDGAVSDEILKRCAAIGAMQGSARRVLDLLHLSGKLAEEAGVNKIGAGHFDEAVTELERHYWMDTCSKLSGTNLLILAALSLLRHVNQEARVMNIYNVYKGLTRKFSIPTDQIISKRWLRELLAKEIVPLGVVDIEGSGKWGMFTFDTTISPKEAFLGTLKLVEQRFGPISESEVTKLVRESTRGRKHV